MAHFVSYGVDDEGARGGGTSSARAKSPVPVTSVALFDQGCGGTGVIAVTDIGVGDGNWASWRWGFANVGKDDAGASLLNDMGSFVCCGVEIRPIR